MLRFCPSSLMRHLQQNTTMYSCRFCSSIRIYALRRQYLRSKATEKRRVGRKSVGGFGNTTLRHRKSVHGDLELRSCWAYCIAIRPLIPSHRSVQLVKIMRGRHPLRVSWGLPVKTVSAMVGGRAETLAGRTCLDNPRFWDNHVVSCLANDILCNLTEETVSTRSFGFCAESCGIIILALLILVYIDPDPHTKYM